jgi:hypothetical protein
MAFTLCAFFRHSGSGDGFRAGFTVTGGILTGGFLLLVDDFFVTALFISGFSRCFCFGATAFL